MACGRVFEVNFDLCEILLNNQVTYLASLVRLFSDLLVYIVATFLLNRVVFVKFLDRLFYFAFLYKRTVHFNFE